MPNIQDYLTKQIYIDKNVVGHPVISVSVRVVTLPALTGDVPLSQPAIRATRQRGKEVSNPTRAAAYILLVH